VSPSDGKKLKTVRNSGGQQENREQESEKMLSRQLLTSFRHGKVRYIAARGEKAGGQL